MDISLVSLLLIMILFFIVAFLYSSVGHGGASGYLAILSFFSLGSSMMSTTALMLNIAVAGIAAVAFLRAKHFSLQLSLPFILTSIPMAFLGGALPINHKSYNLLLSIALLFASSRLLFEFTSKDKSYEIALPNRSIALLSGGVIGLLSGIVGVGGGIFLSPLIMLMKWGTAKQTAATSAAFIIMNSIAGLFGRALAQTLDIGQLLPFLLAAVGGGYVGSRFGATKFSSTILRRLLAIVLIIAAIKLLLST